MSLVIPSACSRIFVTCTAHWARCACLHYIWDPVFHSVRMDCAILRLNLRAGGSLWCFFLRHKLSIGFRALRDEKQSFNALQNNHREAVEKHQKELSELHSTHGNVVKEYQDALKALQVCFLGDLCSVKVTVWAYSMATFRLRAHSG